MNLILLEACSTVATDIGFILDSSGSLQYRYNDEKYFLKTLASSFDITNSNVRTSVITFSSWAELSITFSEHQTTDSFNDAIDGIPLMGYKTRIDRALRLANTKMFKREFGARPGVSKVLVLLTDGAQTREQGAIDPAIPAEELRRAGVYLVVIGIGSQINVRELIRMAGDTGRYYTAASFDELVSDNFIRSISKQTCPGKRIDHMIQVF